MSSQTQHGGGPTPGTTLLGRFRISRLLARGGMSFVYAAHDLVEDRDVAVKLLDLVRMRLHGDEETVRSRFERELDLAGSIRHPGIVEGIAGGEWEGIPFLVQRLVAGPTLADVIEARRLPDPAAALQVMTTVASAVAFAHQNGVLHRDLKPSNIVLEGEDRPVILDFGLARLNEQTAITAAGLLVGTPAYLAPELFDGEAASAASDIFSAGVTFFEYLTGVYPFSKDSLFYSIVFEEAPAPRSLRPDLPRALEAVILQMIAKRPADRYAGFAEVHADLLRVSAAPDTAAGSFDSGLLAWEASAERALLALPYAGRAAEQETLSAGLTRTGAGKGTGFLISGDAGVGKSRLAEEVIRQARLRGFAAFVGRAVETYGDYPYQPFAGLLRHWAQQRSVRTSEELASAMPADRSASTSILAGVLGLDARAPADRAHLWESYGAFFDMLAAERPALVVLEDFHVADGGSLALLRHLLADNASRRVLLLVTYRRDGSEAAQRLAAIEHEGLAASLPVGPLPREEVDALLDRLLRRSDDLARLSSFIWRETEGTPLFVAEVLRLLKAKGTLVPHGPGYRLACEPELQGVPEGIRAVIQSRLARIPVSAREIAEVAAVCGDPFRARDIEPLVSVDRLTLLRTLRDLEREHHLIVAGGPEGYRFAHGRLREALYEELSVDLRREYHLVIARGGLADAGDEAAPRLARHFEAAGEAVEAAAWHRRAGLFARRRFAFEVAAEHYRRALALDPACEAIPLRLALGEVEAELGELASARTTFEQARASAAAAGNGEAEAQACYGLSQIADRQGDIAGAIAIVRSGLTRFVDAELPELAAQLHRHAGHSYALLGEHELADAEIGLSVDAGRRSGNHLEIARSLLIRSRIRLERGKAEDARALLDQADVHVELSDDPVLRVRAPMYRGWLEQMLGNPAGHLECLEAAYRIAARGVGPGTRAMIEQNLSAALLCMGEYRRAKEVGRRAADYAMRSGTRRLQVAALANVLTAAEESGDLGLALETFDAMEPLLGRVGPADRQSVELERAALLLELDRRDEAIAILAALADSDLGMIAGTALLGLSRMEIERGSPDVAPRLASALDRLEHAGDRFVLGRARITVALLAALRGDVDEAVVQLGRVDDRTAASPAVARERAFAEGVIAEQRGEMSSAVACFAQAYLAAEKQECRLRQAEAALALARAEDWLGNADAADDHRGHAAVVLAGVARGIPPGDRCRFIGRSTFAPVFPDVARLLSGGADGMLRRASG